MRKFKVGEYCEARSPMYHGWRECEIEGFSDSGGYLITIRSFPSEYTEGLWQASESSLRKLLHRNLASEHKTFDELMVTLEMGE